MASTIWFSNIDDSLSELLTLGHWQLTTVLSSSKEWINNELPLLASLTTGKTSEVISQINQLILHLAIGCIVCARRDNILKRYLMFELFILRLVQLSMHLANGIKRAVFFPALSSCNNNEDSTMSHRNMSQLVEHFLVQQVVEQSLNR